MEVNPGRHGAFTQNATGPVANEAAMWAIGAVDGLDAVLQASTVEFWVFVLFADRATHVGGSLFFVRNT